MSTPGDLRDRAVLVVGGAGGIGRALCRSFVDAGARVAAVDVTAAGLDRLRAEVPGVVGVLADIVDPDSVVRAVAEAEAAIGPTSSLVNVAGLFRSEEFAASTPGSWAEVIGSNLLGVMNTCHAVVPGMLARGHGAIVNFASTAGEFGSIRPAAAYAAAKGGVIAFTKSLAREVSPRGVIANCVSPGPIDTAMFAAAPGSGDSRTLVGRMGAPADLVGPVLYLASPAAGFVTGAVWRVNGGSLL